MAIRLNYQNLFNYLLTAKVCQENELKNTKIEVKLSRNFHWVLNLFNYTIVVKQASRHRKYYSKKHVEHEWLISSFFNSVSDLFEDYSITSEIIHFDGDNSIIIYKYPKNYIDLNSFYEDNTAFSAENAKLIGRTLAKLHYKSRNSQECYKFMSSLTADNFHHQLLYDDYFLCRIQPEDFSKLPVEVLNFMVFYQKCDKLREAVTELVTHHRHCCLIHNNLQFKLGRPCLRFRNSNCWLFAGMA